MLLNLEVKRNLLKEYASNIYIRFGFEKTLNLLIQDAMFNKLHFTNDTINVKTWALVLLSV